MLTNLNIMTHEGPGTLQINTDYNMNKDQTDIKVIIKQQMSKTSILICAQFNKHKLLKLRVHTALVDIKTEEGIWLAIALESTYILEGH